MITHLLVNKMQEEKLETEIDVLLYKSLHANIESSVVNQYGDYCDDVLGFLFSELISSIQGTLNGR